ncbi:MAG: DUF11 domain-containing protein [Lysobacterales bacterium]
MYRSLCLITLALSASTLSYAEQLSDTNVPYVRSAAPDLRPAPINRGALSEVLPTTLETGGLNTLLRDAARTYQVYYHPSQLAGITAPVQIVGMRYRQIAASLGSATSTWPTSALTFSQYDVQLSRASAAINADGEIASTATSFAANQNAATVVTTRSGALTVPVNAYVANPASTPSAPNPFGPTINFTTPYTYTPGQELMITIRHSGAVGGASSTFFSTASFANGVADAVSSTVGSSATNPNGFTSPVVIELVFAAPQADLAVVLSDTPDPVIAGQSLSYAAVVTNTGPDAATDVAVTLPLPAGTSFVSAGADAGGSCTGSGPVSCSWPGATANGASRTATLVVGVPANAASGSLISASATVSAASVDPDPTDNTATAGTAVTTAADLSVTITDSPDPAVAGTALSYSASLSNGGASDAQDATLVITLPAGVTPGSVSPSAGGNCAGIGTITCTWAGATPPTTARTVDISAIIAAAVAQGSVLSASAQASSTTVDPVSANNTATTTTTVNAVSDLAISLSDTPDPVVAGSQLSYTAVVTNSGPSDAAGVTVNLTAPAGTSFVSGNVVGGGSCVAGISCSISGSVAAGGSRTLSVTVLVSANTPNGTVLNASASVASSATDPQSANNTASTSTSVIAQADLVIALSATPAQALANQPLSFVATSTNNGPADAQDVAITLTLSADLRYSSHTAAGANCTTPQVGTTGTIVCTWPGATAPGGVRTLTLLAYSNNEGSMSVAASTASPTTDPVPNNNAQSAAVTVGLPFTEIPSLNQTGLLLLTLLTALAGVLAVRRQR